MNLNIIYVCCLSRMMRKYHVRFLEGKAPAMGLTYSTIDEDTCRMKFKQQRDQIGIICRHCNCKEHYWLENKRAYECKKCYRADALKMSCYFRIFFYAILIFFRMISHLFSILSLVEYPRMDRCKLHPLDFILLIVFTSTLSLGATLGMILRTMPSIGKTISKVFIRPHRQIYTSRYPYPRQLKQSYQLT